MVVGANLPKIATTISSLSISIEPRETKYSAVSTSPLWTSVSPGGTCVVLYFIDNARKQPGLAPETNDINFNPFICLVDYSILYCHTL